MAHERIVMEPVGWGGVEAAIAIRDDLFGPDALAGLDEQSHIEVVFHFHRHADEKTERGARHPRDRTDWPKVGIFAQRGRMRMNRIGIGVCRLVGIEGLIVHVRGLDAVDGTPVLDIKPWWTGHAPRGEIREPDWAREIMRNYW
jgi:tRNA (Thr-GGU) A37 N-methylase